MSIASDLAAMLAGWDHREVVLGDWVGRGLMEEQDVMDTDRNGDPVLVRRTVLKLRREDFLDAGGTLTVSRSDTVTVDGVEYQVADPRVGGADGRAGGEEIDGRELHLVIRRVAR